MKIMNSYHTVNYIHILQIHTIYTCTQKYTHRRNIKLENSQSSLTGKVSKMRIVFKWALTLLSLTLEHFIVAFTVVPGVK